MASGPFALSSEVCMDKTKRSPIPEKTAQPKEEPKRSPDPPFVRGTIEPTTKKER
jgi:hypothetical protein